MLNKVNYDIKAYIIENNIKKKLSKTAENREMFKSRFKSIREGTRRM